LVSGYSVVSCRVELGTGSGVLDFFPKPECHFLTKTGSGAEPVCNFEISEFFQ